MWLNQLCTLDKCKQRKSCAHLGPEAQFCYFEVEKELCEILGQKWEMSLEIDDLLRQVQRRLHDAEGTSEHLVDKIAERMAPPKMGPPELEP